MDALVGPEPPQTCALCPRLVELRTELTAREPDWFNAPVPSFGPESAKLLVVGLAPGLRGANRTGRPFTGDFAGDLLYGTLLKYGFAEGRYEARPDDGLRLVGCMITNAVRCLPPQNKPTGVEIRHCRPYLAERIRALPNLQVIVTLGRVAFDSTLTALGQKRSGLAFSHGCTHAIDGLTLIGSYHCSRYNTNTGRLTEAMFHTVFEEARTRLD